MSASDTLGTREASAMKASGTLGTGEYSGIAHSATAGSHEDSVILVCGTGRTPYFKIPRTRESMNDSQRLVLVFCISDTW